jgi:hypothetical protein
VQHFATPGDEMHGGTVFWNRTTGAGPTLYVWPDDAKLNGYQFNGSTFNPNPISQGTITAPSGRSGGVLTVSANGSTAGTGIVWSSMPLSDDGDHGTHQGILRAFDADNLATEVWDSQMNSTRDNMGLWPKNSPPTVVNGRVYMASFSNVVNVFGLLNFTVSATPSNTAVTPGNSASYTVSTTAQNGFAGNINLSVSGLPTGTTAVFSPASVSGTGSSTLTVTTTTSTATGSSTLTITGTSGALTQTTTVSLAVLGSPDFTVSASPSSQPVNPGGSTTYTVSVGALNGFSGAVNLSVSGLPTGATAAFSPASVSGTGSSTMTVTTTTSTATGSSTLTITGTSGSLTHTTTVILTVTTSSGSSGKVISIDFVGLDVPMASTEVAGVVAKSNWNSASGASRTSPLTLVDETGSASGATVSWTSNSIWQMPITDQAGNPRMMKGYLDTGNTTTTTVSVTGLPSNSTGYNVYVYADGDNGSATRTGIYQISGTGITTTSINLTDAASTNFSGTFTQANNSNGNYVVFAINATAFTVSAAPGASTDAYPRAPINGIQIVPN